ncbi:hypothetical protein FA95DRAFT_1128813 [Auriscalpium vulgare]|uniref:Uncharacterized protein n=1 Tax=Auriscalpium vulgare TaxID=40419 RepID=A0ACB8R410_9AGAM|nr:hypothetical protein FA95DRAFT_1128813 [Auriscalpium vulgare]
MRPTRPHTDRVPDRRRGWRGGGIYESRHRERGQMRGERDQDALSGSWLEREAESARCTANCVGRTAPGATAWPYAFAASPHAHSKQCLQEAERAVPPVRRADGADGSGRRCAEYGSIGWVQTRRSWRDSKRSGG